MNTDPVFSGGAIKAALLLLVAVAVGVGAWAVAEDMIHISLPDIDTDSNSGPSVTLSDTELSDTTIDPSPEPVPEEAPISPIEDPLSSAGLATAIQTVHAQIGPGHELTSLTINDVQTQFIVRKGNDIEAWSVRADDGSLTRQDASISITGSATIDNFAFELDQVKPGAVDRMLAQVKKISGAADLRPSVLRLDRDLSQGLRPPEWTINAEGNGHSLTYKANENGGRVHNVS